MKGDKRMKIIKTGGITYLERISGGTDEWYYGMDFDCGDLYEAEELFREGKSVPGRKICLVHFPDGEVFFPVPKAEGQYGEVPVYLDGRIYLLNVDFPKGKIQIFCFDCQNHQTALHAEVPLASVKDCYNLGLQTRPLTLSRQCVGDNEFEIVWPEKAHFAMEDHDSFFLRDGDRLFFNRWHEEGDGEGYRYWEETVIRDLQGNVLETLPGDVMLMPDGELWNVR